MSRRRHKTRGQSVVELALIMPVLLLFLLTALDFGRVYLGWINLNQMTRIAANFAATDPDADFTDPNGTYQTLVLRDARATNCDLSPDGPVNTVPSPTFSDATPDLGDSATVGMTCKFGIVTPIISTILGNKIAVSASSTFDIRTGAVNNIPTGGGGTSNVPVAEFSGSPLSGTGSVTVVFADLSSNAPLTWAWNFGDGATSGQQSPTHTYTVPNAYSVSLTVSNPAGFDTETKTAYVRVDPTVTGLDADFTSNTTSGPAPLSVTFTSTMTGGTPTAYLWTFGDGQTSTAPSPTHVYSQPGPYDVSLRVTDASGSNTEQKNGYISVAVPQCVVPNVSDGSTRKVQATNFLQGKGFQVATVGGQGNWFVRVQSPQGGLLVDCGSTVTLFQ